MASADQIKLSNELYPRWLVFGGDGGGQLYAFDLTGIGPRPVIRFDGIDPQGAFEKVAVDFASFMKLMSIAEVGQEWLLK